MGKKLLYLVLAAIIGTITASARGDVKPGIDRLRAEGFELLKGKRVGLITNPTGVDSELKPTVDIMHEAEGVDLVALFGPEHGVRGDIIAGGNIANSVDSRTGLKVFSLYGKTYKPTAEMLKGIDVMVYDIQDIGSRSYTFISTMGKAMEACADNGIPFVVLDRPNPLGGNKVEGCPVEKGFFSFVSQYPIPYIYGLTAGELAMFLNEEVLLSGGKRCDLTVVKCEGWKRDMLWEDTGLDWVLTSPNIPTPRSAIFYPVSGITGEMEWISIGIGTALPFQLFGASWIDSGKLLDKLEEMKIPGWKFRAATFRPRYGIGSGKGMNGVQPYIEDYDAAELTLLQFYLMQAIAELYPAHAPFGTGMTAARISMFDKVVGTSKIRTAFKESGCKVDAIREMWNGQAEDFKARSRKYYLYD